MVVDENRVGLPQGGEPSTHILKPQWRPGPDDVQLHDMVTNEMFCMRVARAIDMNDVATVATRAIGDRPTLFVTRYDRSIDANGNRLRIHQEDLAQACGVTPCVQISRRQWSEPE